MRSSTGDVIQSISTSDDTSSGVCSNSLISSIISDREGFRSSFESVVSPSSPRAVTVSSGGGDEDTQMYVPDSASQLIQRSKCLSVSSVCTSQEGSQCGTPRKHNPQEVMRSLEKLQVSREDNPALLRSKRHPGRAESPAPPDDLVLVVPPDGNNVDHSLLIRSPPPQLRQEQTASPTLVMDHSPHTSDPQSLCNMSQTAFFSSTFKIEARREQAERDAAEIISLQKTQLLVSNRNSGLRIDLNT